MPFKSGVSVSCNAVEVLWLDPDGLQNQVPWGFPIPFLDPQGWEAWHEAHNLHNQWSTLVLLFSSLWVTHPADIGSHFIVFAPLLACYCGFFFVFGYGVYFFGGFQHPPMDGCSTACCNSGALRGDEHMSFYSAILIQKSKRWAVKICILDGTFCIPGGECVSGVTYWM